MASVKSLGVHQPAGLPHAIQEQFLAKDAPGSSYSWNILSDVEKGEGTEDELLTTKSSVIWSRGGIFRKAFKFDLEKESVSQALLANFPMSQDKHSKTSSPDSQIPAKTALDRALVVILKTQAHIYFLSGTSHIVQLPFAVEAACAGPVGVIIQRKLQAEDSVPVSLKFPRVPPNSFVSSQLTAFGSSQQAPFSTASLGNVKALQYDMKSTLENMWESPLEQPQSQWPRLVSLLDPLQEIGLVVVDPDAQTARGTRKTGSRRPTFLDQGEELLHIEHIKKPTTAAESTHEPLILAITLNRDLRAYSVWRLTYLDHEDPFLSRNKQPETKASRRRSSMQPAFVSEKTTPVQQKHRESFGGPLPGKRNRKSEKIEKIEKPLDLVSSLEQQDKETAGVARRSSRRLSSMLARADLSASHERAVFNDQPHITAQNASRKRDSQGSHQARISSSYNHQVHPSLGSLLEAPLDIDLDEGFLNMGLDDHDFDGLQHEVMFTKIDSLPFDSSNVRYSISSQPARSQSKIFILTAPPYATDENQRSHLLLGIQDPVEKRLQLRFLHVKAQQRFEALATGVKKTPSTKTTISVVPGELRKAQNVVDSCKIVDGDYSALLVLSESMEGRSELSVQAPWSELTRLQLPLLLVDNTRSLQFRGRAVDRDVRQRKSEVIDVTKGGLVGLRHSRMRGVVDVLDNTGRAHSLRIQLQPTCIQVLKVLGMCRSILPESQGERIHTCWLHVMQWLLEQEGGFANIEWSAVTIVLLTLFLALGQNSSQAPQSSRLPLRRRRHPSSFGAIKESDDWRSLETSETANSLGCPSWMTNRGWQWALDEDTEGGLSLQDQSSSNKFMSRHIALAKDFLTSAAAVSAVGPHGYLPTAANKDVAVRRKVVVDIMIGLHLLMEEQKLDIMTPEYTSPGRADLRVIMGQLARWLRWHKFSTLYDLGIQEELDTRYDSELELSPALPQPPFTPDVFEWIQGRLAGSKDAHYVTPADIYFASSSLTDAEKLQDSRWETIVPRSLAFKRFFKMVRLGSSAAQMVEAMRDSGISLRIMDTLPEAILTPFKDAISLCQPRPPSAWSGELLDMVNRSDISLILDPAKKAKPPATNILAPSHVASWDYRLLCQSVEEANNAGYDEGEGTERQAVIRMLFDDDRRLNEAQDLLSTHKTRLVHLQSDPAWTESAYLEKQKELVSRIATGTLAIPAGRALLYFSLRYPLLTQKFHVGGFNLNCIVKPANNTVGVDKALFTEEKVCWGFFHQGVAAGLAISPEAKGIDNSWILYNKAGQDLSNRHAGFLLALGLNGHLKGVAKWVAFKYLTPKHTMTSVGLLLGLAASYIGTMDSLITRLLSVHATRMLPRGAAELNLSPLTQTSAIIGIGLVYCNSQHRRMSEIMLSEIEHIDDEDEEEPLRSECYRLAAGFALGLINLGKGGDLKGLHDMRLAEKLITYGTTTKNVDIVHILDRAAAGAVMAIALIFMKSEDQMVARKIDVPTSILQFDYIRPDILLLRTVAKNLILWSKIEPTFAWIQSCLPAVYHARHRLQGTKKLMSTDLPFFSILAGICFSIALRFSGSASTKVRDLLLHYLDQFMRISRIESTATARPDALPPYDEELARSNARMCQDVVALSASIVMAGTGDIPVLRRLRSLHGRDDMETPYGSHLAAHLAIGALFLGCGTATFGSSDMAIAALLISFYPIFPTSVMDNRSHLQAFRHFWVLATEQRCLVAKDVLSGQPVSVKVQIKMAHGVASTEQVLHRTTPCLLPPLDSISRLATSCGPLYWDVDLDFTDDAVRKAFAETQSLYLRRRPHREGPFTSTLAALGKDDANKVRQGGRDPLEWVFGLEALQDISYAERTAILQTGEEDQETGVAVDARMEMERGIAEGGDRERLEGARLLFEWGAVRNRLLKTRETKDEQEGRSASQNSADDFAEDGLEDDSMWWMKDSVIDELKGKVWLVGRENEP